MANTTDTVALSIRMSILLVPILFLTVRLVLFQVKDSWISPKRSIAVTVVIVLMDAES